MEKEHKKRRSKIRAIAFLLMILCCSTLLTGCVGHISHNAEHKKEKYDQASSHPKDLLVRYKDQVWTYSVEDDEMVEEGGMQTIPVGTSILSGKITSPNHARQIAYMMASTVLGMPRIANDHAGEAGASSEMWASISFSPGAILSATNTATVKALEDGGALESVYRTLLRVGQVVFFAVWFMGFVSSMASEQMSMETALKSLLQLVCGLLIVNNAIIPARAFATLCQVSDASDVAVGATFTGLVADVKELMGTITVIPLGFGAEVLSMAFGTIWLDFGPIIVIAMLAMPFYQAIRAAYKIVSIMISRYFELIFGVAVAPLAIAMSAQRGFDHGVIMYLRKLAAAAVQPVLIALAAMSFNELVTMTLSIFGSETQASSLHGIAAITAISTAYLVFSAFVGETKHIAREFVGH